MPFERSAGNVSEVHFNAFALHVNWFNLIFGWYPQTIVHSLLLTEGLKDKTGIFNSVLLFLYSDLTRQTL